MIKASKVIKNLSHQKFSRSVTRSFNLTKEELREFNHLAKNEWVKPGYDRKVGTWLLLTAGCVFGMVVYGGYVRLTNSGLSMITWDLHRVLPPRTPDEWEIEFSKYKAHPQYVLDNKNITVEDFKEIYYPEFIHRQLGKSIGVVYGFPFLYFLARGALRKKGIICCSSLLLLGGFQGFIGYWMVKSGLKEDYKSEKSGVSVSPYRLSVHFTFATLIFGIALKAALFLLSKPITTKVDLLFLAGHAKVRKQLILSLHVFLLALISGSVMAGSKAGGISNTFPKMGD